MKTNFWRVFQISDSAFPTGGFAHSNGLEAALQHGEIEGLKDLENFLRDALWQVGFSSLPFANVAFDDRKNLIECDELADAFFSNHVANRASRIQGLTFYTTCEKAFMYEETEFGFLKNSLEEDFLFHYSGIFGAILKSLSIERSLMQRCLFQISLRGMLSASVRLGILGPYQAQQYQTQFSHTLEDIISHCGNFNLSDVAQTAPLFDLYQGNQDRLYSRLFQS